LIVWLSFAHWLLAVYGVNVAPHGVRVKRLGVVNAFVRAENGLVVGGA
jgi:hypothetical protein